MRDCVPVGPAPARPSAAVATSRVPTALVAARALHPPWNEGSRVIAWNFARAVGAVRPVSVLSLTRTEFAGQPDHDLPLTHVYARATGGALGDYATLRRLDRHIHDLMASEPVDVVHLLGLPLALAPRIRWHGARVVAHVTLAHHAYQGSVERLRAAAGWRLFDRWIDAYALSSPALQPPLRDRGLPPSKLRVIPAAIDTDYFAPGDAQTAREELGIREDVPLVLYLGTLSPLRFPHRAVERALLQTTRQLGFPLRFYAFAPAATHAYNRPWSEAVERTLQGLTGVTAEVQVADLPPAEKRRWLRAADVVLLPFAGPVAVEPPLTLLEAMACGAAVLVSPEANRSKLVRSGENGFVYHEEGEMARHLVTLLAQRRAAGDSLRRRARETVVERHSMAAAAGAATQLWDTLRREHASWP